MMCDRRSSGALRACVACALLLVGAGRLAAAEPAGDTPPNSLRAGAWALRFGSLFSDYFDLSPSASVKHHLSEHSALVLQVDLSLETSNRASQSVHQGADTTTFTATTGHVRHTEITITPSYAIYPRTGARVVPVIRFGPTVGFEHYRDDAMRDDLLPVPNADGRTTDTWRVGVSGQVGFEWFFLRQLSLGSDYGIAVTYSHARERTYYQRSYEYGPYRDSDSTVQKNFNADTTHLGLMLSYYF